jgi:hypothetical protein
MEPGGVITQSGDYSMKDIHVRQPEWLRHKQIKGTQETRETQSARQSYGPGGRSARPDRPQTLLSLPG